MAGRKPKPAEAKEAAGNPGKRPIHMLPEGVATASIAPPPELSGDALKVWETLAPRLIQINFLRATDIGPFSRYCEHVAQWWKYTKRLNKEGVVYTSKSAHGELKRLNPVFQARDRIERQMVPLEDRFGLTTASRQQVMASMAGNIPKEVPPGKDKNAEGELPLQGEGTTGGLLSRMIN